MTSDLTDGIDSLSKKKKMKAVEKEFAVKWKVF